MCLLVPVTTLLHGRSACLPSQKCYSRHHWAHDTIACHHQVHFPVLTQSVSSAQSISAVLHRLAGSSPALPATAFRYHSHPVNAPRPSQRDAESQHKYQALLQCTKTHLEPFVAVIVSPYDPELPNQVWMSDKSQRPSLRVPPPCTPTLSCVIRCPQSRLARVLACA